MNFISAGIIAGVFIGGVVLATKHFSPYAVGIAATIPMSIFPFLFIQKNIFGEYTRGYIHGIIVTFLAIFLFLYLFKRMSPLKAYIISIVFWFFTVVIISKFN